MEETYFFRRFILDKVLFEKVFKKMPPYSVSTLTSYIVSSEQGREYKVVRKKLKNSASKYYSILKNSYLSGERRVKESPMPESEWSAYKKQALYVLNQKRFEFNILQEKRSFSCKLDVLSGNLRGMYTLKVYSSEDIMEFFDPQIYFGDTVEESKFQGKDFFHYLLKKKKQKPSFLKRIFTKKRT